MATDDEILAELETLGKNITDLRGDFRDRGRKMTAAITAAIIVGALGIVIGGFGWEATHDANADRKARSIGSCLQYNAQQSAEIVAQSAQARLMLLQVATAGGTQQIPAEFQPTFDKAVKQQEALIRDGHKLRDCTPAGIDAYLKGVTTTTTKGP